LESWERGEEGEERRRRLGLRLKEKAAAR